MIKLSIVLAGKTEEVETPSFTPKRHGLSFFDTELNVDRIITWDLITRWGSEAVVTDEQKAYAERFQVGYSDSNPQHTRGPNTTATL